ncbi:flagellar basal body L-ring protein FlgH, partial [bacterium]|nr:flagellar basal body L-ring protein FlgH [bacterium]
MGKTGINDIYKTLIMILFSLLILVIFSGCNKTHVKKDETEDVTDILNFEDDNITVNTSPASLYSDVTANGILFLDHKARRKNDIVTIKIVESSKASDSATTKASKKSSASAGVSNVFGFESTDMINKNFPSYRTPSPSSLLS